MGSRKNVLTQIVTTLTLVALIAVFTGLFIGDSDLAAASPIEAMTHATMDQSSASDTIRTGNNGATPGPTAPAMSAAASAPKQASEAKPQIKYNTITDRSDTMNRHPVLMDNSSAHNASVTELTEFLKNDDTVKNKYDNPNYTCANFVTDLQHNAESIGINGGYAGMNFVGKEDGHAINVFPTTDDGLVYVDATAGKLIVTKNLREGMKYYNMGTIAELSLYF